MKNDITNRLNEVERLLNDQQFIFALNLAKDTTEKYPNSIHAHISYANLCRMAYVDDIYTEIVNDKLIVESFVHYKQAIQIHTYSIEQCKALYEYALSQHDASQISITHQRWMYMKHEFTNIVDKYGSGIAPFQALYSMATLRFGENEYNIAKCISTLSGMNTNNITIEDIEKSISQRRLQ